MSEHRLRRLRYEAPADLRDELAALGEERRSPLVVHVHVGSWIGAMLGAAALVCALIWSRPGGIDETLVAREIADAHVRSLMEQHLFDVASSDRHTVKPWFAGKVDFAPSVVDLSETGFALVGGRIDYIAARPVAALVYRHDRHTINVFTWPDAGVGADAYEGAAPRYSTMQGFNVWQWSRRGMAFYAISDVNANTLRELVEAMRRQD
jgi:anti-sigma factor RsiW